MIFEDDNYVSDLTKEESLRLKAIFMVHFVLTTFGFQGYWYPNSFLFYNSVFIGAIIWTLHQNSNGLAMKTAATVNTLAIVFDIIVLSVYYPSGGRGGGDIFSATMAILNLLLRPVSLVWLVNTIDKSDSKDPLIAGREPGLYQDIEAQQPNA